MRNVNDLIEYVQTGVRRVHGPGHDEVAACAAIHAKSHVVQDMEEDHRDRLDAYAERLEAALEQLQGEHRHIRSAAENALHGLLEDLKR